MVSSLCTNGLLCCSCSKNKTPRPNRVMSLMLGDLNGPATLLLDAVWLILFIIGVTPPTVIMFFFFLFDPYDSHLAQIQSRPSFCSTNHGKSTTTAEYPCCSSEPTFHRKSNRTVIRELSSMELKTAVTALQYGGPTNLQGKGMRMPTSDEASR